MSGKLALHDGSGGADIPYDGGTVISVLLYYYEPQVKVTKEIEWSRTLPNKATIEFIAPDGSRWRVTLDQLS